MRTPAAEYLIRQRVSALGRALPAAKKGDATSLHQARVATRRLRAALAALPQDHRQVIERYYLLDQSLEEIAQATGGTKGSVRAMCYRARKRLRELMGRSSMYFSD